MFDFMDSGSQQPILKLIGIGGGGGNAVAHMIDAKVEGVDFICINTDAQALGRIGVRTALQIGANTTRGLGAGTNPEVGRQAALEDKERLQELIAGADMLFIATGMGGGTGTGAAPIIAQIAKEMHILTVAVVTKPFSFEGGKRMRVANAGIEALSEHVDSLITIPNEKLMQVLGDQVSLVDAFAEANNVLRNAMQGIAELITHPGIINIDFADVRAVMSEMGMAMMGSGTASGENRAREATEMAINSPLLEEVDLSGAQGILVNVASNGGIGISEYHAVGELIKDFAAEDATIKSGTAVMPELEGELRVTVIATGIGHKKKQPLALVKQDNNGRIDYDTLDQPTVIRKRAGSDSTVGEEVFDIPAFLRKQAD